MRKVPIKHLKRRWALAIATAVISFVSAAQSAITTDIAPPVLPVYVQPVCPAQGYLWAPGYWAWAEDGAEHYWVPGTWVEPPADGLLWTPGYWGWKEGVYKWYPGYWGTHVGFYGGVVYGFGYGGIGFDGGYWDGNEFYYNRHAANVNVNVIRNVYERPVVQRNKKRVSYNGSPGGIAIRPTRQQMIFAYKAHREGTAIQKAHARKAGMQKDLRVSVNRGRPPVAATSKVGVFGESNVVPNSRALQEKPQENLKRNVRR